jgi:hypothetical protein
MDKDKLKEAKKILSNNNIDPNLSELMSYYQSADKNIGGFLFFNYYLNTYILVSWETKLSYSNPFEYQYLETKWNFITMVSV